MADTRAAIQKLDARMKAMQIDRDSFDSHWSDIRDLIAPHRGRGLSGNSASEDTDGSEKGGQIYDTTGLDAVKTTAAGMQSGLTPQSRPWFRLGFSDFDVSDSYAVRTWLSEVERRMRAVFAGSNFYNACFNTYSELAAFQTAAFSIVEDFDTVIHCRPFTIGEYYLATGPRGNVNTFVRKPWMTAIQMVEEFGREAVSAQVKNAYDTQGNSETQYQVIHFIEPNDDRIDLKDARARMYRSIWYEASGNDGKPLRVRGFDEFPVMCPRWDVVGNAVYGTGGPGMDALPDVKGLQKMRENYYIATDMAINPPLQAPSDMRYEEINDIPGGMSYVNNMNGQRPGIQPLHEVEVNPEKIQTAMMQDRVSVERKFYVDLFRMISSMPLRSGTTATEIAERHEEKLLILGPVLERIQSEMLNPSIDRTFAIMLRLGSIPPPPPEIQGRPIKVEYVGLLAQAQKIVCLGAVETFAGFVGSVSAVAPDVLDKVDFDETLELYADGLGISPTILRPDAEVQAIREARAQKQQAEQQGASMLAAADGAKTLSETDMASDSALNQMLGR